MDIESRSDSPRVSTLLVAIVLTALAVGQVAQIAIATSAAADSSDPLVRRSLVRLAWLALAMLSFNALISFWLVIRFLFARSRRTHVGGRTSYVDAWSTAGKRFQLDDAEDEAPEDADEDDPDRPE